MVKAAMTVLMPSWYYEKKDLKRSPSFLDGLDIERESRYRREGARFIINVGTKMGLRYDTMATGVVYFHRFYMFHSFKTFPRYVTACCCLFLAGKVEETPKKCKDIIRIARTFMTESQFAQFGDDPKEEVMTLERILLQTIKFDLQVDHPYGHLLKYAKCLKGDKNKLQNMVQMAWTFINDSLCTTLCLQWEPEVIAIALMYLAGKLSKFEVVDWVARVPRHTHWWDMFVEGMSIELLEDICHQVLDLYSMPIPNTPQDSPPATPPTKSTRKTSQPPSPIEASTSPAQIKPKEAVVGQPIPRLEPGELKRKTVTPEVKKEVQERKIPRITEGKAIPTISNRSPKVAASNQVSNTQPSSPATPATVENLVKNNKPIETPTQRVSVSDTAFRSNITEVPPRNFTPGASFLQTERAPANIAPTTFASSVPPPTASYTQSAPPFYTGINHESQAFPNVQQPPPQIFPQRHQFQHPPPPVPPSGPPPGLRPPPPRHQYSNIPPSGVPPFNTQFPPPRPPPNIINNPPPAPVPGITSHPPPPPPQGLPPHTGMMRSARPPPPPGIPSYGPRSGVDLYNPRQELRGGRPPGPRGHFEKDFLLRRESEFDGPFPHDSSFSEFDPGYHMHSGPNQFGQDFERQPPPPRRFNLDHQNNRRHERGPHPPLMNNVPQQQGAPTGIPPVRITGRY